MEIILALLQFVFELMFSQGARAVRSKKKPAAQILKAPVVLGYAFLGVFAGLLSVWVFPHHFVRTEWLQILNVVIIPVFAGMLMEAIGKWRVRHDQEIIAFEGFICGYFFALALAVVRFMFAV
jgi:hypothetical protein